MKLAIVFPGIGYHCDKPLLYYGRKVADECGYDKIITLNYTYDGGDIRGDKEKMMACFKALYSQAVDSLNGIDFTEYEEVLFISKSVGTIISSAYACKYGIKCKQILYTPLEVTFEYNQGASIAFIGDADPWSDVDRVIRLAGERGVPVSMYKGVNHSLEGFDTEHNIVILCDVMKRTRAFLEGKN